MRVECKKGLQFILQSWKNVDNSWVGDTFEIIDFCLPYILVEHIKDKDSTSYPRLMTHAHLFNINRLNLAPVSSSCFCMYHNTIGLYSHHKDKNVQPVLLEDLEAGDAIVPMDTVHSDIYIIEGMKQAAGEIVKMHMTSVIDPISDDTVESLNEGKEPKYSYGRAIEEYGQVDPSFLYNVFKYRHELKNYFCLFCGFDKCASCSKTARCKYSHWIEDRRAKRLPILERDFDGSLKCVNEFNRRIEEEWLKQDLRRFLQGLRKKGFGLTDEEIRLANEHKEWEASVRYHLKALDELGVDRCIKIW